MWIFNKAGFFSVVGDGAGGAGYDLVVRARARVDLDRLRETYAPALGATVATPGRDYPYRARITREHFAEVLARSALDVDYDNFKGMVGLTQGAARAHVYLDVWRAMNQLEQKLASPLLSSADATRRRLGVKKVRRGGR